MQWIDVSAMNAKWDDAWLSGLGGGVFGLGSTITPKPVGQTPPATLSYGQIQTLQDLLNVENDYRERAYIQVTGSFDAATCLTVIYYVELLKAGDKVDQFLFDMLSNWELAIAAGCAASQAAPPSLPPPGPTGPTPGPGPTTGPALTPVPGTDCFVHTSDGSTTCDCEYVELGSAGPHIEHFQQALNLRLVEQGYDPIPVTGVWDVYTCGANYAIRDVGAWYDPGTNPWCVYGGSFNFPYECEGMIVPKKPGASRAGMFAIGGLVLAAGAGAAYWVSKR